MQTVTEDKIFETFKSLYESQNHEEEVTISHTFNDETGQITDETEVQAFDVNADLEALVRSIIKAMLSEIRKNGIAMGDSTATKIEVG